MYFQVELKAVESKFPFRDGYLHIQFENNHNSPFFSFFEDDDGFLILKSFEDKVDEIYKYMLSLELSTIDDFKCFKDRFTFIFFDKNKQNLILGKDRLGISSLIMTENPLIMTSHGLNGDEHPPGITILKNNGENAKLCYPKYSRHVNTEHEVTDKIVSRIIDILSKPVNANFPVLFSGGLDSSIIAGILGYIGAEKDDLINFAASENAPDRIAAKTTYEEIKNSFPNTDFRLHTFNSDKNEKFYFCQFARKKFCHFFFHNTK